MPIRDAARSDLPQIVSIYNASIPGRMATADLVPVTVTAERLEQARAELGELPGAQRSRLQTQYGLSDYDAGVLVQQGRAFVAYFEEAARVCGDAKEACNWTTNELLSTIN